MGWSQETVENQPDLSEQLEERRLALKTAKKKASEERNKKDAEREKKDRWREQYEQLNQYRLVRWAYRLAKLFGQD